MNIDINNNNNDKKLEDLENTSDSEEEHDEEGEKEYQRLLYEVMHGITPIDADNKKLCNHTGHTSSSVDRCFSQCGSKEMPGLGEKGIKDNNVVEESNNDELPALVRVDSDAAENESTFSSSVELLLGINRDSAIEVIIAKTKRRKKLKQKLLLCIVLLLLQVLLLIKKLLKFIKIYYLK